jgi:glycine cleavage system transcriptional repressor
MADRENLILTAVGPDKIGLIEKISEFIARHECNIEDSKMAVFCGEFAWIILITGESRYLLKIANAYNELAVETGLNIWVKTPSVRQSGGLFLPYKLTASCLDHPGIVHRLSCVLSALGINIESMETKTYSAPVSGTPIFRLETVIAVPTKTNLNLLRERLGEVQREENIDIELSLIHPSSTIRAS